jgi:hypothetical protein
LGLGQEEIFELQLQDFTRTEAVEEHEGEEGEIAKGAKAAPELGDLRGGKGNNDAARLLQAQAVSDSLLRLAVAQRRARSEASGMGAAGELLAAVKAIERTDDIETMIDRLRSRLRLLFELRANIITEQRIIEV